MSDLIRREDALKAIYDALTYANSGQSEFVQQRIRALPAVQFDAGWQPIETAPKDGTVILTWGCIHNDGGVDMGETPACRTSWWLDVYASWYCELWGGHEPTHWMPLPAPPAALKGETP